MIYSTLKMLKKVHHNQSKDEKAALKDIRNWEENVVQDKGSRFVVLDNEDYINKS